LASVRESPQRNWERRIVYVFVVAAAAVALEKCPTTTLIMTDATALTDSLLVCMGELFRDSGVVAVTVADDDSAASSVAGWESVCERRFGSGGVHRKKLLTINESLVLKCWVLSGGGGTLGSMLECKEF
jgi:hypothetical protein